MSQSLCFSRFGKASVKKICKLANQVVLERYLLSSGLWRDCCSCLSFPVTRFVAASQMFPVVEEGWDCGWGCAGGRMMGCMATGGGMSCVRKLDLSHLCFSLNFYFLMFFAISFYVSLTNLFSIILFLIC